MTLTNQGYILRGVNDARIEPLPFPPKLKPDEVLLKTIAVGICGTDLHFLRDGSFGFEKKHNDPIALGHETAAQVVEVGSNVVHLKPGDRVAVEPNVACENCQFCFQNKFNICKDLVCLHSMRGSLKNYFIAPAKYCFKAPDNMSDDEIAMIEPLSCVIHGIQQGEITFGDQVLITGSGPIGLLTLHVIRAYGATKVVMTDLSKNRLKIAKKMGANETILMSKTTTEQEAIEKIRKAFGGELPNVTVECSGAPINFRLGVLATRDGGKCILIGLGSAECEFPINDCISREITLIPMIRYNKTFPTAIHMISSGKINLANMVSHRFSFKDCEEAFKTAASGQAIKVIIYVNEEKK